MKRESFIAAVSALLVLFPGAVRAVSIQDVRVEPTALLVTEDDADQLAEVPALRDVTGDNTYLTSAAISPHDSRQLLVSTTFHGIYESSDGGASWNDLGDTPAGRAIYRGNGFYEDLSAAAYDPQDPALLWLEMAQDGEIIAVDRRTGAVLEIPTARGVEALARAERAPLVEFPDEDAARRQRRELAADHVSFYLSPWQVDPERLDSHMEFAAEHGMTAVVIDFKDDFGRIAYDSALELHREVGAVRGYFDAERVVETVHDNDLYLIARIVVFKDRELFGYDGNRYALWDRRRDVPWGVFRTETDEDTGEERTRQVEHWVDPFSEEVWDYNIAIARELQELGVDEIQFDYIRTPADGRTGDIEYRYRKESPAMADNDPYRDDREEALSAFLARARQEISLPISIDVFGFNGWYRMSYLGQDIARLARHVDVISPMLYPSHFPRAFFPDIPYLDWAETLYREGVARGRRITGDSVLIRPYIQSFLIGGELQFEEPRYTDYLKHQIRGSLDAGASGFTLWNFSGRYYMASRGLRFDGAR
ncbi:MAG: putative glycoside hydrolase [Alkalispirochaeta sp.]